MSGVVQTRTLSRTNMLCNHNARIDHFVLKCYDVGGSSLIPSCCVMLCNHNARIDHFLLICYDVGGSKLNTLILC